MDSHENAKGFTRSTGVSIAYPAFGDAVCLFAAGIIVGQIAGPAVLRDSGSELTEYLQSYAGAASQLTAEPVSVLQVFAAYFRVPLLLLLLGFCTFGAVVVPVVCAVQGFCCPLPSAALRRRSAAEDLR